MLLVRRLLGSYPTTNLHDPEIYMAELLAMFLRYPLWAGERGIHEAKRESPKFIPSVPTIELACEKLVKSQRQTLTYAQQWDEQTKTQLEERAKIAQTQHAHRPEFMQRMRDEMAAAGMPILGDNVPSVEFTAEAVKEKYKISDEAWNQIPDQTPYFWKRIGEIKR
jgi:hypothetical protein